MLSCRAVRAGPLPASWVNLTSLSFLALIQNKLNGASTPLQVSGCHDLTCRRAMLFLA